MNVKHFKTTSELEQKFNDTIIKLFKAYSNEYQSEWRKYQKVQQDILQIIESKDVKLQAMRISHFKTAIKTMHNNYINCMDRLSAMYLAKCYRVFDDKQKL